MAQAAVEVVLLEASMIALEVSTSRLVSCVGKRGLSMRFNRHN